VRAGGEVYCCRTVRGSSIRSRLLPESGSSVMWRDCSAWLRFEQADGSLGLLPIAKVSAQDIQRAEKEVSV